MIVTPQGRHDACPRCGLYHDPGEHGEHRHDFPIETISTCRSIVRVPGPCACGEKPPSWHWRLGERMHPIDLQVMVTGNAIP